MQLIFGKYISISRFPPRTYSSSFLILSDLGVFHRHPTLLDLYTFEFTPTVIRDHGSVEKYLIKSLGEWNHLPESEIVWNRKLETKIKLNDWPYALPREVM